MQAHLTWLEAEIAREAADDAREQRGVASVSSRHPQPGRLEAGATPGVTAAGTTPPSDTAAEALLSQYSGPRRKIREDVRKGCLLYFAVALMLVVAGVAGLWFAFRR